MKECKIILIDEVNCACLGLSRDHAAYFYEKYGIHTENYFFNPKFQLGSWDGKIRYFHKTGKTFITVLDEIVPSIIGLGYDISVEDKRVALSIAPPPIDKDFFSNIIGKDGEPWEVRDYQVELVNSLLVSGNGIGIAGTGAGKAQPLNSNILTPMGWKKMGDIDIGGIVTTPNNKTSTVIGVFPQGQKEIYEITFHDGTTTRCCKEHLWKVNHPVTTYRNNTETRLVTTGDIIDFLDKKSKDKKIHNNISIPLCDPIEFSSNEELTIEPYLLGLLLGDGMISSGSIIISSADEEILESVKSLVLSNDLHLIQHNEYDYSIVKRQKQNTCPPSKNILIERLKEMGLYGKHSYDKFIPNNYKNASIDDRFNLIQGLMDTDGTVSKDMGRPSYSTTSKRLAEGVCEIIQSLGGICTITSRIPSYTYRGVKKQGRLAYTCHIAHPTPKKLFRLERKRKKMYDKHADGRTELSRRIKSIDVVSSENAQCILLDSKDHLYITDNFIVTHNTSMCAALALSYERTGALRSLIIVPDTTLTDQTKDAYAYFGLDVGEFSGELKDLDHQHVVSTWQTLKNDPTVITQFKMVIVDEAQGLRGPVLSKLMNEYGKHISYRFGVTGTLPEGESDATAVRVAVGSVQYEIPAHVLIEQGHLSTLNIDIIQLTVNLKKEYENFKEEVKGDSELSKITYGKFKDSYFPDFTAEKSFLHSQESRQKWIAQDLINKSTLSKGNVLCLVNGVAFGKKLAEMIPDAVFLHGKDKKAVRKEIYKSFADNDNLIVIATVHIAGTGLDIERIFNLVFVDIGKSFIRVIQAIGRGLRKAHDKDHVDVTDICSDLKYSKRHVARRIKHYKDAKYPYNKRKVDY